MTPRAFSSSVSERILFVAPRALNAPARCRFSHLKKTSASATSLNDREVTTGVRCTRPAILTAACLMRSNVSIGPRHVVSTGSGSDRVALTHQELDYWCQDPVATALGTDFTAF